MGLYYPYVHLLDEAWLKVAVLYWPKMARIVPDGYEIRDNHTTVAFKNGLDFIVDLSPDRGMRAASEMLIRTLEQHGDRLIERYRVSAKTPLRWHKRNHGPDSGPGQQAAIPPPRPVNPSSSQPAVYWDNSQPIISALSGLHRNRTTAHLRNTLTDLGLATKSNGPWIGLHPDLAWVYMCALAEQIALPNRLSPVTDQSAAHLANHGWSTDRIAAVLLGEPVEQDENADGDLRAAAGLLAVGLTVPANLAAVSTDKIIRIRQRYGAEFDAFHDLIATTADELRKELTGIVDPRILDIYLEQEVNRRFLRPAQELEKAIRGLGIETAYVAANAKFELPAALVGVGGAMLVDQPLVAGAGAVTFGLLTLGRSVIQKRAETTAPSAASYLWRIKRATAPKSLPDRLFRRWRRPR
jgi:hypothetical protein